MKRQRQVSSEIDLLFGELSMEENCMDRKRSMKEQYTYSILFILNAIEDIEHINRIYHYAQHLWMSETRAEAEAEKAPDPGG